MNLWFVAALILLFNFPFGYWRANVKKFSLQWALAIHVPVPFVILLRFVSGIGFAFVTYPVLVGAFFTGQFIGAKFHTWREKNEKVPLTSCLVCDIFRTAELNTDNK